MIDEKELKGIHPGRVVMIKDGLAVVVVDIEYMKEDDMPECLWYPPGRKVEDFTDELKVDYEV